MSEKIPPAKLPPEIGSILEGIIGSVAEREGGEWIADHAEFEETVIHNIPVSRIHIKDEAIAGLLGKSVGHYTTLQTGPLNEYKRLEDICSCLTEELRQYLAPHMGKTLLICGVGNADLSYDSLGPETAKRIYPKIDMESAFEKAAVFCPGVVGTTNIRTAPVISSIASSADAACVLVIDAAECHNYEDICSCINLTDAGVHVGKDAEPIDESTIGKPVITIGVPTSIRAEHLGIEVPCDDFLTITEIGNVIKCAASVISCAVLQVVYPELDYEASKMLVDGIMLY